MLKSDRGNASAQVIVVCLVVGLLFSLLALKLLSFDYRYLALEHEQKRELVFYADDILDIFNRATDEKVDSQFSGFFAEVEAYASLKDEIVEIKVADVSSRLNPNFCRTSLFEKSDMGQWFVSQDKIQEFKDLRAKRLPSEDVEVYREFFKEEVYDLYFSPYTFVNFNVAYADELAKLIEYRTQGRMGYDAALGSVNSLIEQLKLLDYEGLKGFFGAEFEAVYPVINVQPLLNVNFVDEELLKKILSYPFGGKEILNFGAIAQTIVNARESRAIDMEYLRGVVSAGDESLRVYEYLGVNTWVWEIEICFVDERVERFYVLKVLSVNGEDEFCYKLKK
ncbi:MAG: hypothetical protein JXR63_05870 [Spirochaetales bacterium]|nr:hypothetical protein [Spirochaetales bacterium]